MLLKIKIIILTFNLFFISDIISQEYLFETNKFLLVSNNDLPCIKNVKNLNELIKKYKEFKEKNEIQYRFSMKYSMINKSFINFNNDTIHYCIPFEGYKSTNEIKDYFYDKLSINLNDKIPTNIEILQHLKFNSKINGKNPLIEILIDRKLEIELLSKYIYKIISCYFLFYEDLSMLLWKKRINQLSNDEINILKEYDEIKIRITPKDRNLYYN